MRSCENLALSTPFASLVSSEQAMATTRRNAKLYSAKHQFENCPLKSRRGVRARTPNPSFEARPNGKPPGPGRWYGVHFHQPGPGVLPSVPPELER